MKIERIYLGKQMGRITIEFEVVNGGDSISAQRGQMAPESVRRSKVMGVVDSGAAQLILPGKVVEALGLSVIGEAAVRFADNRREKRMIVEHAEVHLLGRKAMFNAIVEPNREDALIGAIVLEALDFIIDCPSQALVPRDPERIFAEID